MPAAERPQVQVSGVACPLDEVPQVAPDEPLADVLQKMNACADGRALVVEAGRLVGIVSPTDVMRQLEHAELASPRQHVRH